MYSAKNCEERSTNRSRAFNRAENTRTVNCSATKFGKSILKPKRRDPKNNDETQIHKRITK